MRRIRRGLELSRKSWSVLRANRRLLIVPVCAAATSAGIALAIVAPGLVLVELDHEVLGAILTAVGMYLSTCAVIAFAVALATMADAALHSADASLRDGLAVARSRAGAIAGWSLIVVTINLVIQAFNSEDNLAGRILAGAAAAAWSLITFLVVPILALEGIGPVAALRRSAGLFRARWAEQIGGNVVIGGIVLLVGVLPSVAMGTVGVLLWLDVPGEVAAAVGITLVVIGVLGLMVSSVVQSAIRQVFAVALYRYLGTGEIPPPFSAADIEHAVRRRGRGRLPVTRHDPA